MNTRSCVYADEFHLSALEDAFSQFLRHAKRCDEDSSVVAASERFGALSDAAYDIIAW
jgi:hypothetical protein